MKKMRMDKEDKAEMKAGKKPSAKEEKAEKGAVKKSGSFQGKSNYHGHSTGAKAYVKRVMGK